MMQKKRAAVSGGPHDARNGLGTRLRVGRLVRLVGLVRILRIVRIGHDSSFRIGE